MSAMIALLLITVAFGVGLAIGSAMRARSSQRERAAIEEVARRAATEASAGRDDTISSAMERMMAVAKDTLGAQTEANRSEMAHSRESFGDQFKALNTELERVRNTLQSVDRRGASTQAELAEQLKAATAQTQELAKTTANLTATLGNSRTRGQLGERLADDILQRAGFVEHVNFERNKAVEAGREIPDFTFLLPKNHKVHMDVKFPLDNYARYLDAEADEEKQRHLKQFLRDVRARVTEITKRDYIQGSTLECVLLFIPNESIFSFVYEKDPTLIDDAMAQRVVLCAPTTLFGVLSVIRQSVENFAFERTSNEILEAFGQFRTQWTKFTDSIETVQRRFDSANSALEELGGPRKRQLERQLSKIDDLRQIDNQEELDLVIEPDAPPLRALPAG